MIPDKALDEVADVLLEAGERLASRGDQEEKLEEAAAP